MRLSQATEEEYTENHQEEVLEKYDKESRLRVFDNKGLAWIVSLTAVFLSLYHLYTSYFGTPVTLQHRSLHVAVILILVFLLYPPFKQSKRNTLHWPDALFALMALSTTVYVFLEYEGIIERGGIPNSIDLIFGAILVLLVLEAARRVTGWGLPLLAVLFLLYGIFGREMAGLFRHRGYAWDEIVGFMYQTTEGVYSTAIGVSATYSSCLFYSELFFKNRAWVSSLTIWRWRRQARQKAVPLKFPS